MLLAESDAKFKYCPLLTTHDDKLKFCLGSMCMMWRLGPDGELGYCGAAGSLVALSAARSAGSGAGTIPVLPFGDEV
jgi:hypothetical protein